MAFLGFPDTFPDPRTIWLFKESIAKTQEGCGGLDSPRNRVVKTLRPVAVEMEQ